MNFSGTQRNLDPTVYGATKSRLYLRNYADYFARLMPPVDLLELGVFRGGSLMLWRDYFGAGVVAGLDIEPVELHDPTGRIRIYQGRQDDTDLLDGIGSEVAPSGFDVIIDDASHLARPTRTAFWHLFDHHLRPGGIYVIEDWRTGYWSRWPDGASLRRQRQSHRRFKSHDSGLVGFVKQLVDELGADAYTHPSRGSKVPHRLPRFRSIEVFPGQVFVVKATDDDDEIVGEGWQPRNGQQGWGHVRFRLIRRANGRGPRDR